jgi:Zn-dependent protease with chaperone function
MNFYQKTALMALLYGLTAPSTVLADNKYWQEFKQFRENPSHKLIFDREAASEVRDIVRDLENAKKVGYWERYTRPVIGAVNGVVITADTMPVMYAYIDSLCKENGLDTPVITVTQDKGIFNAAAQKILMTTGAIFIGQDLLKETTESELEGVIAHEIGHIKHNHVNKMLALNLTTLASYIAMAEHGYINLSSIKNEYLKMFLHLEIYSHLQWVVDAMVIGKKFEREADAFAGSAGKAEGLIGFFERLERKAEKQDADFNEVYVALENAKDTVAKDDLNTLWQRYYIAKFGHAMDRGYRWFYHNTPFGPHPSNEERIANAKAILAKQAAAKELAPAA